MVGFGACSHLGREFERLERFRSSEVLRRDLRRHQVLPDRKPGIGVSVRSFMVVRLWLGRLRAPSTYPVIHNLCVGRLLVVSWGVCPGGLAGVARHAGPWLGWVARLGRSVG